jgi:hypothetical protein
LAILNKWKTIILILLVVILLYTIGINARLRRYIEVDKDQFITRISNLIIKSKVKIDNITSNKDEVYIEYKDIELLTMYHDDLERSVFEFKKKADFINKDVSNEIQKLWDKYKYVEEINLDSTSIYYENLLKRIEGKENIMLNDDVYMLESIYNLYNEIRKDFNKIITN